MSIDMGAWSVHHGSDDGAGSSAPTTLYAEDLPVGTVVPLGSHRITEEEIVGFARRWDPLPMHTDPDAARNGVFGGLIASGVHVFAIYQRLHVDGLLCRTAVIAGRRLQEMTLRSPTRAGDVLTASVEVLGVAMRPARGDAVMTTRATLVNQDGKLTFDMVGEVLIRSRPTTGLGKRREQTPEGGDRLQQGDAQPRRMRASSLEPRPGAAPANGSKDLDRRGERPLT